jgi:hypothetical protein
MDNYWQVYSLRLDRYGKDYKSRVQGQREKNFENLLVKSIYRVDFDFNGELEPGIFERYKQDETETLHYLLTRVKLNIPNGTILEIPNKDGVLKPWMVFWVEDIVASGYNKYVMLKMTHYITWTARDGQDCSSWVYMFGQQNGSLRDELKSNGRASAIYSENSKSSFFIMPRNANIKREDYLEIGTDTEFAEAYRVTGYDIQSSEGIEYVTIDPVYLRDNSMAPIEDYDEDDAKDFFWLNGGGVDGD